MRKLDVERVLNYLIGYARKLVEEKKAILVVLIGSLARGDYTATSDADLVIVVEHSSKRPHERIVDYLDPEAPIDIEPRVYTIDEMLKMARERRRIVEELLTYGKVLAGDTRLLELIQETFNSASL